MQNTAALNISALPEARPGVTTSRESVLRHLYPDAQTLRSLVALGRGLRLFGCWTAIGEGRLSLFFFLNAARSVPGIGWVIAV
jgi:hypothetical protein